MACKCDHILNWKFPSKFWFFVIYLNLQWQKSLKFWYCHILSPELFFKNSINPTHQDLSNNTKGRSKIFILELNDRLSPHFQLFFLFKTWFSVIYWIFSNKNRLKFNISPILSPNLTKYIPLNPAPPDLSTNTKGTYQFLSKFQLRFNLIFSEKSLNI
jgi:hypothetical protein